MRSRLARSQLLACAALASGCFVEAIGLGGAGETTSSGDTSSAGAGDASGGGGAQGGGGQGGGLPELCGNGSLDAGEQCDPPNGTSCGPDCQYDCPPGWTPGTFGDCYTFVPPIDPGGAERPEAEDLCAEAGRLLGLTARLATPNEVPDIAVLESIGGAAHNIWTGARFDNDAPLEFVWEGSGEEFTYQHGLPPWAGGQPDGGVTQPCVFIADAELHTYPCADPDFGQPFGAGCELVFP